MSTPDVYNAEVDEMTGSALAVLEKVRERLVDPRDVAIVDEYAAELVEAVGE